jgi:hypothetical protein
MIVLYFKISIYELNEIEFWYGVIANYTVHITIYETFPYFTSIQGTET